MDQSGAGHICWLIGHPVKHSLSPGMQRVLYENVGIKGWKYRKKDLGEPQDIKEFISYFLEKEHEGFNVTVPYKETIIKFIDEVDEAAVNIGAVNTVNNLRGRLKGYNTDWVGFRDDLKDTLDIDSNRADALVLGAGGVGRAVVYALSMSVVSGVIYLYDKDISRARELKKDFSGFGSVKVLENLQVPEKILAETELLVNATPVGMRPGPAVIDLKGAPAKLKVYDVVYNRITELVRDAKKYGLQASGGAGMLAGQGAESFYIWSGGRYGQITKEIRDKMKKFILKEVNNND